MSCQVDVRDVEGEVNKVQQPPHLKRQPGLLSRGHIKNGGW